MGRTHNLALNPELDQARPNAEKISPAERQQEIATAMARLKAKIEARSGRGSSSVREWKRERSAPPAPIPLSSERRRQQIEWLLRVYGFQSRKTHHDSDPQLHLDIDPKLYWALRHHRVFPLNVNEANPALLLRVPGFGPKTVQRIIEARKFRRLRFADLLRLKVPLDRAKYFVTTDEANPYLKVLPVDELLKQSNKPRGQLDLFASAADAEPANRNG